MGVFGLQHSSFFFPHAYANVCFFFVLYRICIDLYSFVGCCCQVFFKDVEKKISAKESVRLFTVFIFPRLICLSRDCTAHVCLGVTAWHLSGIQREGNSSITWSNLLMPSFPPTCIECYFCYYADYVGVKIYVKRYQELQSCFKATWFWEATVHRILLYSYFNYPKCIIYWWMHQISSNICYCNLCMPCLCCSNMKFDIASPQTASAS